MNRVLLIKIPESMVTEPNKWLLKNTREGAVRAYVLKHPEVISQDLTIENLLAINVLLDKWKEEDENFHQYTREADLLFERNGTYYLVETKRYKKHVRAQKQIAEVVECFKSDFRKNKQAYKDLVPVIVTTDDIDEIRTEWV